MNTIIITLFFCFSLGRQLKFIEVVSRHGVRDPIHPNNYDFSNRTNHADGGLTIQGKSMHYLLGKDLYEKYWQLLFNNTIYKKSYDQSIIYAQSTNLDRTIESMQCQLYGLLQALHKQSQIKTNQYYFPPFTHNSSQQKLNLKQAQTISSLFTFPIHVQFGAEGNHVAGQNYQGDFLVKLLMNLCPNQEKWKNENGKSQLAIKIQNNDKVILALQKINQAMNRSDIKIQNAYEYFDNYISLKATNQKYLPVFEDPSITDVIYFLYLQALYLHNFYTQQQRATFSTTLIQKTIFNIKNAIAGNGPKIVLYSAHDITLAALFAAMNFSNIECIVDTFLLNKDDDHCYDIYPPFGSTFIFEVWQQKQQYILNMLINGKKYKIPICKYSTQCSLEQFQKWFSAFRVASPNVQCGVGIKQENAIYYPYFICFFLGVIVTLAIAKLIAKLSEPQKSQDHFELPNSQ